MIEVEVDGAIYEFPDTMSRDEIKAALQKVGGQKKPEFTPSKNDTWRSFAQGVTLGWGDELEAGLNTGFGLAGDYSDELSRIQTRMKEYRDNSPKEAVVTEMAGGGSLPGVGSYNAMRGAPTLLKTAGTGALLGGTYGAGAADPGERLKGGTVGAGVGAVASPLLGFAGEYLTKGTASLLGHMGRKLTETPQRQAVRLIRDTVDNAGLTPDDVVSAYRRLGPNGTLMDVDENLLQTTKSLANQFGPMKREAREFVENRAMGSVDRMAASVRNNIGSDDAIQAIKSIAAKRDAEAAPFYDLAWKNNASPKMLQLLRESSTLKRAMSSGRNIADAEGIKLSGLSLDGGYQTPSMPFKAFHYAKKGLDDMIKAAKSPTNPKPERARALMSLKTRLLDAMDSASPDYAKARNIYSSESELIGAVEKGRDFFKMSASEFDDAISAMSATEREMFKKGAVRAVMEKLEGTQLTHDVAKKLLNRKDYQAKFSRLFDSPDDAMAFLTQAGREAQFVRSRQAIAGGSPTAELLASEKQVNNALNDAASLALDAGTGNGIGVVSKVLNKLFGGGPPSPEMIAEASKILLAQGMPESEVRRIVTRSLMSQQAPAISNAAGQYGRAAAVPAVMPLLGSQ